MSDTTGASVAAVGVISVRVPLAQPVVYGDWVVRHRAYAIVAARAESGEIGWAFGLTRDGPVEEIVRRYVAPQYVGRSLGDPASIFEATRGAFRPVLGAGIGLRALSLVDIATWDLAARVAGRSLRDHLGGTITALPVMGIVGYPPDPATDVAGQAQRLQAHGFSHLKLPAVAGVEANRARMEAAAPHAEMVSLDGAWTIEHIEDGVRLAEAIPQPGWLEDPVAPERIELLAELHREVDVRIAMGDEQGGPGFPDALLLADAVDVVRLDATCAGGISGLRPIVERVRRSGKALSFHVFARLHAPIAAGLGATDAVIEWSEPGMIVDPVTESLPLPELVDGRLRLDGTASGLGDLFDRHWLIEQQLDDPDGVLTW